MIVHPFRALRAHPVAAPRIASVPYDVVDADEAQALAATNPLSFLHVVRAEIDLPVDVDPYSDAVYEQAAENLQTLRDGNHMVEEQTPCLFAYRMTSADHVQLGLLACCSIDEYEQGIIRKHEFTRRDKEDDRTRHILAVRAQCGPVLVAYRDLPVVDELLRKVAQEPALLACDSETGVRHEVWRIAQTAPYEEAFTALPQAYIADGHHRSASAARAREACRSANPGHDGTEEYNYFLTAMFPASQMRILAYNRVVGDLQSRSPEQVLEQIAKRFEVRETTLRGPQRARQIVSYLAGRWYELAARPDLIHETDPVQALDVSILHRELIEPILGVKDLRADPRISFVGGARGTDELQRRVDLAGDGMAFSMYPTSMAQLMAIADAGQIMPPKSTWFEPKLRSGLVVHLI